MRSGRAAVALLVIVLGGLAGAGWLWWTPERTDDCVPPGYTPMDDASEEMGIRRSVALDAGMRTADLCGKAGPGCLYSARPDKEGWFVHVVADPLQPDGSCVQVPGAGANYYYDTRGVHLRTFPDL